MAEPRPRIYLDYNAGAPLRASVRAAMLEALADGGNASSVHREGRVARRRIETAREAVAGLAGAAPAGVTFTSGGSEANATVLTPNWSRGGKPQTFTRLFVSAVEHPSVLAGGRFAREAVSPCPVDANGVADLGALARLLRAEADAGGRPLVSLMIANNETGVLQPVAEAAALAHKFGGLLHSDAVQAAGRVPLDLAALGADVITLSAHKLGGPQGAGAIVRADEGTAFAPLIRGGGQERNQRAGTENVAAIGGFGLAAAEAHAEALRSDAGSPALRDRLEAGLLAVDHRTIIFGNGAQRLANTVCFAVPGIAAETAIIGFDLAGVAVSAGAACSSGKVGASHVLAAMGHPPDITRGGIRVSFGRGTREAELASFLGIWQEMLPRLKKAAARAA